MRANACWLAIQFLTRIPTPTSLNYEPKSLGLSVICFPIAGLLIGGLLFALSFGVTLWGAWVTAALIVVAWFLVTGGLHLDGLADTVDAWVGGHGDREKMLRIMKDPAVGPMGALALMSVILLKVVLVWMLLVEEQSVLLLLIPLIARVQMAWLLVNTQYAKPQGLGVVMQKMAPQSAIWGLLWMTLIGVFWLNSALLMAMLLSLGALLWYRGYLLQSLQGITGDTLGAWVEVGEVLLLLGWLSF